MIDSITIAKAATFGDTPEIMSGLSAINFLFGSNGTGKTTVSRIIADEKRFPACQVTWKGGTKLDTVVYNRDFVDHNFSQSSTLPGVFTLGEKHVETLKQIASVKEELDKVDAKISTLNLALDGLDGVGGKKKELTNLEDGFKERCWAQKRKHDARLQGAFEGLRNNAENFKSKVLLEVTSNTAALVPLAELENRCETVFGPSQAVEQPIPLLQIEALLNHERNIVLKKRVVGKDDVDIAAVIKHLGNSDWVQEGRSFYDVNEMICPFCQQKTTGAFKKSLNDYFDETFAADTKAINDLETNYSTDAARLQRQISSVITGPSKFLELERLKAEKTLLDSRITINIQRIAAKKKEASRVIELESLKNVLASIVSIIDAANTQINNHNTTIKNLSRERSILTAQVWKFIIEELKADVNSFQTAHSNVKKGITTINSKIEALNVEKKQKTAELRELERQTTSVQPTIDGINSLLSRFGFRGFALAQVPSGSSYKLVRQDGSDAKATLSEGERTFVAFLYFYHLLKGSNSESGMTANRVVVFDDPVSSLDSDVLFIVGSLIKGLFDEVRSGSGYIKQIFVLTHNVYFHKEVSFNPRRPQDAVMNEETFWIVRRPATESNVTKQISNPIKTSYELLWCEVRKPDRSNLTIQNTLRRILENYFKILGGIDPDDICSKFEGKEKLICKSLFSWVNDGSHSAHDDLYISTEDSSVETYLAVFRAIFDKTGHTAHYLMMMGDSSPKPAAIVAGEAR